MSSTALPFEATQPVCVAALYRFQPLDPHSLRGALVELCATQGICGTLILATEGINGTVAGSDAAVTALLDHLAAAGIADLELKFSRAAAMPFRRMKVRIKAEIVTMGVPDLDPTREAGTYLDPEAWNELIADPETVVVDTRNAYEIAIGSFQNAIDPGTRSFREFPAWVEANRARLDGRRIAMFCTGGIRCEKATAYVRSLGMGEVYHLKGGILKYLETVDPVRSRWDGECFVFDERVSVGHGLVAGDTLSCRACGRPVTARDRASPGYVAGVSCPACIDEYDDADRARFAERQRQAERGAGAAPADAGAGPGRRRVLL